MIKNIPKSDISFYMSVHKDDEEQPDWTSLQNEMKEWMKKSGFKVYSVSDRSTPDYRVIEINGAK